MNVVHLYPGAAFHCDGFVVGDRQGLLSLREAIDSALKHSLGIVPVFVNDGEGYQLSVLCVENIDQLVVPYTEDFAKDRDDSKKHPGEIMKHIEGKSHD